MKVSIIVPTYNRSQLLQERALRSIFNQTYKDFECIVVDDASSDDTPDVVKKWSVKYIRHDVNQGSAAAKVTAMKEATGEYIVIVDDDNELLPTFLEETVEKIGSYDAVQVGRLVKNKEPLVGKMVEYDLEAWPTLEVTSIDWGWLIKRSVFDKITWDSRCGADEDMDLGIEFSKSFRKTTINKILTIAHGYSEDRTDSQSYPTEKRLQCMEYFMNKHKDWYMERPNELRYLYRMAGRNYSHAGHRLQGLWYFWKSFMASPRWSSFEHFLAIIPGWTVYTWYMTKEELHG